MGKRPATTWTADVLSVARNYCDDVAVVPSNNGHIKVRMAGPKGERHVHCSATPSDYRTLANMHRQFKLVAQIIGTYR